MRKHDEEAIETWKPSKRDVDDLLEGMSKFERKEVNGRKQYPFELFLESKKIISFGSFGEIQVVSPKEYYRYCEMDNLREWIDKQEMERVFKAFPEEKEKHDLWLSAQWKGIRDSIRGMWRTEITK